MGEWRNLDGGSGPRPNFKPIRFIRFRFLVFLLSSLSSCNQHATAQLLSSPSFFSFLSSPAVRDFRHKRSATATRHTQNGCHEPPRKFRFAPALLWRLAEKPLPVSAISAPWPILNNTDGNINIWLILVLLYYIKLFYCINLL